MTAAGIALCVLASVTALASGSLLAFYAALLLLDVGSARHVERLRVEAVRRMLESSECRLEPIARTAGFCCADAIRQAFARQLGTSPERYRAAFRATPATAAA